MVTRRKRDRLRRRRNRERRTLRAKPVDGGWVIHRPGSSSFRALFALYNLGRCNGLMDRWPESPVDSAQAQDDEDYALSREARR